MASNLRYYLPKIVDFVKYIIAIKNRELLRMPIYITERCNSRCKTCGMWRKKNPQEMPLEMFEGILDSIDREKAFLILQGGEPILHPNIEEILKLLRKKRYNYQLFSNGILSGKLVELVGEYKVPFVAISCDGSRETYQRIRGVDNYENIVDLVMQFKGITRLELSYIVSPWNSRFDLLEVAKLAKQTGAILHVDAYDEIKYFETVTPRMKEIYKADDLVSFPKSKCLQLYNEWVKENIRLPCYSVRFSCFITADGTVYSCGRKLIPLGSLKEQSLKEIWHSEKTRKIQNKLTYSCNECWATCYRSIDVAICSVIPLFLQRHLFL